MSSPTAGKPIQCRDSFDLKLSPAAVLRTPRGEFTVEDITVDPPKAGEVRFKVFFSSICHTDIHVWKEPGTFALPVILGHEGSGIVESVGEGVSEFEPGDHVMSSFQGECRNCRPCKLSRTNLCDVGFQNMSKSVMPDHKTRFSFQDGSPIHHCLGCSTFTEYTVMLETNVVKVDSRLPLHKACLLSCGVPTGIGSALKIAKLEADSTVAVIGLGTVGLAVVQGAKMAGATRIIGIDIRETKFKLAKEFGATECFNPKDYGTSIDQVLHGMTKGGVDYCFECVGETGLMLAALNSCTPYGTFVMVGVPRTGATLVLEPGRLLSGRAWMSGLYGGFKPKSDAQTLVEMSLSPEVDLDRYITHRLSLSDINRGFELVNSASCVKCLFDMAGR